MSPNMGNFSDVVRKQLLSSPYVEDVTDSHVIFAVKFKTLAVQKYLEVYFEDGVDGFEKENRGKGSKGRPPKQQFKSIEEEVAYLREENAF